MSDDELFQKPRLTLEEYTQLGLSEDLVEWNRAILEDAVGRLIVKLEDKGKRHRLREWGIKPEDLEEALFGSNPDFADDIVYLRNIEELSGLVLLGIRNDVQTRKNVSEAGVRAGHLISPSLIADIALAFLEIVNRIGNPIPPALYSLIQLQIDSGLAVPNPRPNMSEKKYRAAKEARRDPSISSRDLAKKCGVNQSTIIRWRKADWFKRFVARVRTH